MVQLKMLGLVMARLVYNMARPFVGSPGLGTSTGSHVEWFEWFEWFEWQKTPRGQPPNND